MPDLPSFEITSTDPRQFTIKMNGVEISPDRCVVTLERGSYPEVEVATVLPEVNIFSRAIPLHLISEDNHRALIVMGWTPPGKNAAETAELRRVMLNAIQYLKAAAAQMKGPNGQQLQRCAEQCEVVLGVNEE